MKALRIGKNTETGEDVFVSQMADSQSILVTGRSGSGKTYALRTIETHIGEAGGAAIVLNYADTHTHSNIVPDDSIAWINVKEEGIPLWPFSALRRPDGSTEDFDDVAEAFVESCNNVTRLSVKQRSWLCDTVEIEIRKTEEKELWKSIVETIRISDDEVGQQVWYKLSSVFRKITFQKTERPLVVPGKIVILDLGHYTRAVQLFVSELVLSVIWRYAQVYGMDSKFQTYVICDEFQNLKLHDGSVLSQILCEGRKYKLSVILATQSLARFDVSQKAFLLQATTKLIFHPSSKRDSPIAEQVPSDDVKKMEEKIMQLKQGECIAIGCFEIDSIEVTKPVRIRF